MLEELEEAVEEAIAEEIVEEAIAEEILEEAIEEAIVEELIEEAVEEAVVEELIERAEEEAAEEAVAEAVVAELDAELDEAIVLDEDELLAEAAAPVESPFDRPGQWFVVHTQSGYEKKVKQNLEARISSMNMEERIHEVVIPMEDVVEFKNGKKVVVQKKVFPGYLLVRCNLDDDSWYVVRNTPGVTGFVGQGAKPSPLPPHATSRPSCRSSPKARRWPPARASPASSTSCPRRCGSARDRSPTSRARSSRSTRTSSR